MRIALRVVAAFVAILLLLVGADALRWRHRVSAGDGFEQVEITRVSIASLKNKKEEYSIDGKDTVACSRSVLPMPSRDGWYAPCWWLRGHRSVETRY